MNARPVLVTHELHCFGEKKGWSSFCVFVENLTEPFSQVCIGFMVCFLHTTSVGEGVPSWNFRGPGPEFHWGGGGWWWWPLL